MAATKTPMVDASFVADTAQRSLPKLNRPRLDTETEARLAEVDRRDAAKYASMETLTHQFNGLAEEMEAADEAVPTEVDQWEDTSMVHHIEDARAALNRR